MLLKSAGDELGKGEALAGRFPARVELQETYHGARYAHGLEAELHKPNLSAVRQVGKSSERRPANLTLWSWPNLPTSGGTSSWSRNETAIRIGI